MPMSYDEWLEATYGDQPGADVGSLDKPQPSPVDQDISSFVDSVAEPKEEKGEIAFAPDEVEPIGPAPTAVKNSQSVSESGSVSHSGANFSDAKTAQIRKGFTAPLNERNAASDAEVERDYAQNAQDVQGAVDLAKGNAAQRGQLDAERADITRQAAEEEANLLREQNFQEKVSYHLAQKKEEEAMANWAGAMKAYEATNINPGKLWGDMTGGQRFGTALSVFAHGILAAKGINSGVMQNLNRAIDDNLNAQIQNMEQKGKVAGQFKQMWEAVRMDSESDAEARQKMRLLQLNEFKSGITARLSAMDSDYAKLKAQETYAALEAEEAKAMVELRNTKRQDIERGRAYELNVMQTEIQARQEASRIAVAKKNQELEEKKFAASQKPAINIEKINKSLIYDVTPGGNDEAYVALDPEKADGLRDRLADNAIVINELSDLAKNARELYDGIGSKYTADEADKAFRAMRTATVARVIKKWSGLSYTDKQAEMFFDILPLNTTFTADAVNKTVGDQIAKTREDSRTVLEQKAVRADPIVREYAQGVRIRRGQDKAFEAVGAQGEELKANKKPENTPAGKLIGEAEGDQKFSPVDVTDEYISRFNDAGFRQNRTGIGPTNAVGNKTIPEWAAKQMEMADYVANLSNPPEERLKALQYLNGKKQEYLNAHSGPATSPFDEFGQDEALMGYYLMERLAQEGYLDAKRFE